MSTKIMDKIDLLIKRGVVLFFPNNLFTIAGCEKCHQTFLCHRIAEITNSGFIQLTKNHERVNYCPNCGAQDLGFNDVG